MKSGQSRKVTNLTTQPQGASFSPDGKRLVFFNVDGMWRVAEMSILDLDSGRVTKIHDSLPQPGTPTWSPDGKRIALADALGAGAHYVPMDLADAASIGAGVEAAARVHVGFEALAQLHLAAAHGHGGEAEDGVVARVQAGGFEIQRHPFARRRRAEQQAPFARAVAPCPP